MAILSMRILNDFPRYSESFKTRKFKYGSRAYRNHNALLFSYKGTEGILTGYTRASGFNLTMSVHRGDKHLIAVVMGGKSARRRNAEMRRLLNKNFPLAIATKTKQPLMLRISRLNPRTKDTGLNQITTAKLPSSTDRNSKWVNTVARMKPNYIGKTYDIQIGAYQDRRKAERQLLTSGVRVASLLDGYVPYIAKTNKGGIGTYSARFSGFASIENAQTACALLKETKNIDCSATSAQTPSVLQPPSGSTSTQVASIKPPSKINVERYPTFWAPDEVQTNKIITVTIGLTEDQFTPNVITKPGPNSNITESGKLALRLPEDKESDGWIIDVDLLAPGFDLEDSDDWSRTIKLYKTRDSDLIRLKLKARDLQKLHCRESRLMARLYHKGRFLGSISRVISIYAKHNSNRPCTNKNHQTNQLIHKTLGGRIQLPDLNKTPDIPDLDVTIHYDDPDKLGAGVIYIHSGHLGRPFSARINTPHGIIAWLNKKYNRLQDLSLKSARGFKPQKRGDPNQKNILNFNRAVVEGFGAELYRLYVPQPFKDAFWTLKKAGKLKSIQITSNSPIIPWELVRATSIDGKISDEFLGVGYRLARWTPRITPSQAILPLDHIEFSGVAVFAPEYKDHRVLSFQKTEVNELSKMVGFQRFGAISILLVNLLATTEAALSIFRPRRSQSTKSRTSNIRNQPD